LLNIGKDALPGFPGRNGTKGEPSTDLVELELLRGDVGYPGRRLVTN